MIHEFTKLGLQNVFVHSSRKHALVEQHGPGKHGPHGKQRMQCGKGRGEMSIINSIRNYFFRNHYCCCNSDPTSCNNLDHNGNHTTSINSLDALQLNSEQRRTLFFVLMLCSNVYTICQHLALNIYYFPLTGHCVVLLSAKLAWLHTESDEYCCTQEDIIIAYFW